MADGNVTVGLQDEGAAMKKGKGAPLVLLGLFFVVLLGGLFFLMGGDDDRRVYTELGRKINHVKLEGFDRFWGCALHGENLKEIKSNTQLSYQVMRRASELGQAYGVHLRDECLESLDEIEPELEVLIVHDAELKADVSKMSESSTELRGSLKALVAYLDNPELEFDEDIAEGHVKKITRAWYDFRKAWGDANKLIKSNLDQ